MKRYPIKSDGVTGVISRADAIQVANAAFFDGFMTAVLESKEEADSLDTETRLFLMMKAKEKNERLTTVQAKEKAPQTAAAAQGAKNNVQNQSTAKAAESQAELRKKLENAESALLGLADLLEALRIAMEPGVAYIEGVQLLSKVALCAAVGTLYED